MIWPELTDDILIDWNCGRSTAIWMVEAGQIMKENQHLLNWNTRTKFIVNTLICNRPDYSTEPIINNNCIFEITFD